MSTSISPPVRVAVVYHSGYGHTAKQAEAVALDATVVALQQERLQSTDAENGKPK